MDYSWLNGFSITAKCENGEILISANKEGLLSLSDNLRILAGEKPGRHMHLDEFNSLEEGSCSLIIVLTE